MMMLMAAQITVKLVPIIQQGWFRVCMLARIDGSESATNLQSTSSLLNNITARYLECDQKKMKSLSSFITIIFVTHHIQYSQSCLCSLLIAAGKFSVSIIGTDSLLNFQFD